MKFKRLIIFISVLVTISSTVLPFSAFANTSAEAYSDTLVYSDQANSGTRHVVCTTTEGTGIADYYTGDNSIYEFASLSGDALKMELRSFMTSTHTKLSSYANCRDYANRTDCENGNTGTIVTIYTSYVSSHSEYNSGSGWNREHVWPKSWGGFNQDGGGSDLHHIRPSENRPNSTRGNKKYGNAPSGTNVTGNLSGMLAGKYSQYYEPLDNVKGDVARICLYVYVRWGGTYDKSNNINNVFESIDVLLEWCALDPVDTWEMGRNEVVEAIQGNRNVFIDYPELAWLMFGKEIPSDMVTPSGWAQNGLPSGSCTHSNTVLKDQKEASCSQEGYTGDIRCTTCNTVVTKGYSIPKLDHNYADGIITKQPSHIEEGVLTYTFFNCGTTKTEVLEKNNDHAYEGFIPDADGIHHTGACACGVTIKENHKLDNGVVTRPATHTQNGIMTYSCTLCYYQETRYIDKLTEHAFEYWTPDTNETFHTQKCECGETIVSAHRFNDGTITKNPTHTETGIKSYICYDCGYSKDELIDKLSEHNFYNWSADQNGTTHTRECECGEKETLDHTFNEGVVTKIPTHTVNGEKTYTCTECRYTKTEPIDKLPDHTFGEWINDNNEWAMDHYRVCECGEKERSGHKYGEGVVVRESTHLVGGSKKFTCIDCGSETYEILPKLAEHMFGNWTASENGENHIRKCPCGESETEAHSFNYGIVTTEPTAKAEGVKTFTCKICGAKNTETIPKKSGCSSSVSSAMALLTPFICAPAGVLFRRRFW